MRFLFILLVLAAISCGVVSAVANEEAFDEIVDKVLDQMATEDSHMDVDGIDPYAEPAATGEAADATNVPAVDPDLTVLHSTEDIEKFIKEVDDTPVVMAYFDLSTHEDDFDIYEQLAHRDAENYRFAYTSNKAILEEKGYEGCAVYVYMAPKFFNPVDDKPRARYTNKSITNIVHLKTFIRRNAVPFVGEMTIKNEKLYRNTRLPVVTVFTNIDHEKNEKGFKYIANRVRKVALLWQGKMNFNIANIADFRRDMDQKYDLEEAYGSKTIMVGIRDGSVYYPMEGDFTGEKFKQFVQDFSTGNLEGNEQFDSYLNKDEDDPLDNVITLADAARAANADIAATEEVEKQKQQAQSAQEQAAGTNTGDAIAGAEASPATAVTDATTEDAAATAAQGVTYPAPAAAVVSATTETKTAEQQKTEHSNGDKKADKKTPKKADKKPKKKKFTPEDEVVTLSNLNTKGVLTNKNADIFVQFHKPECDLCRHLKPEFRKTANAFKDDGGMIVAAMDVKANPLPPGFTVETYPTIYFIPANNKKKPVLYTGKQEAGDMIQYLFQHRTTPVGKGSDLYSAMQQDQQREQAAAPPKRPAAVQDDDDEDEL